MNRAILWVILAFAALSLSPAWAAPPEAVKLNNEGVYAINAKSWNSAFDKLTAALKIDPSYGLPRENLAIAHYFCGVDLRGKAKEALQQFDDALFWNAAHSEAEKELEAMIRKIGRDPENYLDRVALGDQAVQEGDSLAGSVEYAAAIRLHDDAELRKKLSEIYEHIEPAYLGPGAQYGH